MNAMLMQSPPLTVEEFAEWANRSENDGPLYELDEGRIVTMPSPGERHGLVCSWIAHLLWMYAIQHGNGRVLSNDTGVILARKLGIVRGPDVMYLTGTRTIQDVGLGHVEDVPTVVVEVLSPTDRQSKTVRRVNQYLKRGIQWVWVVDPEDQSMIVYSQNAVSQPLDATDDLSGDDILPGFACKVGDFFAWPTQPSATSGE